MNALQALVLRAIGYREENLNSYACETENLARILGVDPSVIITGDLFSHATTTEVTREISVSGSPEQK